jgi:hypothetical protein
MNNKINFIINTLTQLTQTHTLNFPNEDITNSQNSFNSTIQNLIPQDQFQETAFPPQYYSTFTETQSDSQSFINDNESSNNDIPHYQHTHTDTNSENYYESNEFQQSTNNQQAT